MTKPHIPRKRQAKNRLHVAQPYSNRFIPAKQDKFFDALSLYGQIGAACAHAGVSYVTVNKYRKESPEFAERFQAAMDQLEHTVMKALRMHAIDGAVVERAYDGEGNCILEKRKYDTKLLHSWIQRLQPGDWGTKVKVDQEVRVTASREPPKMLTAEQREKVRELLDTFSDDDVIDTEIVE